MLIHLKSPFTGKVLTFNSSWLRDHCRCLTCFNQETQQRNTTLLSKLKFDQEPTRRCFIDNGNVYQIIWDDGHVSRYDMEFLEYCVRPPNEKIKSLPALQAFCTWNGRLARQNKSKMTVNFATLITSEKAVIKAVESLLCYGMVFIQNVPPNSTMTEMAMRRLFPIMKTFFGEMWTFSDKPDHSDTAYSNKYIGPHTDNTYFSDPAGLHSLHCIEHSGGEGGENFFVDGFEAAYELKHHDKQYFHLLSKIPVPFEYIENGQHHKHVGPIIKFDDDDNLEQIRFNYYDRAAFDTMPQKNMDMFYEALQEFARIVEMPKLRLSVKLQPGTYVIFDNWRILHARHAYTGRRTMTGCYVTRTDFLSRARTLGLLE